MLKSITVISKFDGALRKVNLLILDDIGLNHILWKKAEIYEIAERRCNKASTILASQIPHKQWYELFPDPTVADGTLDRVIHNAYVLEIDSKISMREVMAERVIRGMNGE